MDNKVETANSSGQQEYHPHHLHIGMRKGKSIFAIFLGFCLWQVLLLSHYESAQYLYSIMRAFQTIIGVVVAWFVNVVLLPYPPKPGSLSEKLSVWFAKRKAAASPKKPGA